MENGGRELLRAAVCRSAAVKSLGGTMQDFFDILVIILPILAALILGFVAKQKNILTQSGIDGLKALVMNFALPAVLFGAFYDADFGVENMIVAAVMFLCCGAGLLLGKLVAKLFRIRRDLLPFLTSGFEAGMMGYGLYTMLFSEQQVASFAMVDLGQVLFVFTVYMALLNMRKGITGRETMVSMVKSPIFLAIVAGAVVGATGLGSMIQLSPAGGAIDEVLSYAVCGRIRPELCTGGIQGRAPGGGMQAFDYGGAVRRNPVCAEPADSAFGGAVLGGRAYVRAARAVCAPGVCG